MAFKQTLFFIALGVLVLSGLAGALRGTLWMKDSGAQKFLGMLEIFNLSRWSKPENKVEGVIAWLYTIAFVTILVYAYKGSKPAGYDSV